MKILSTDEVSTPARSIVKIIQAGLASLDLTKSQHDKAVREYRRIAVHLSEAEWFCLRYYPDIYPQGSMALGTCVRPWEREEFDLDMIVAVDLVGEADFQELLADLKKAMEGFDGPQGMELLPSCLRLNYPGEFHLDLVPAYKDMKPGNLDAVRVASKERLDGTPSDPKSFEDFFNEKKELVLSLESFSANSADTIFNKQATVDPPPKRVTEKEKTILQTVIQLLKRHCLLYFRDRKDRPSSAIITALCSETYIGHQDLYEATGFALKTIGAAVRPVEPRVPNPRYSNEDFADRWATSPPDRESAFFEWLGAAQSDFEALHDFKIKSAPEKLEPWIGKSATQKGIRSFTKDEISSPRLAGALGFSGAAGIVTVGASGVAPAQATSFCGNEGNNE